MSIRKTGSEPITFGGNPIGLSALDFWSWNSSNFLDNTLRGEYAEFIVASALGLDLSKGRINWEPWDLTYPVEWQDENGIHDELHIEIKSSSYLQSWEQKQLSTIYFGIRPTRAWSEKDGYSDEIRRQSDVYIFCLYAEKDPALAEPLHLDGWEFYILPTKVLDEKCGTQKTLSLNALKSLVPIQTDYAGMESAVKKSIAQK